MDIKNAIESVKNSLFWGNWTNSQADALRTLLLEVEKVKLLQDENIELRKKINQCNGYEEN